MPRASSAQGRPFVPQLSTNSSAQRGCPAGAGQQTAQNCAEAQDNGDVAHQVAYAGGKGERNLG